MFSYISKLKLTNYRNFERLNLELPDSSIALVGRNGVGKTNIIEAISVMQPGRGIRSAKFSDMTFNKSNYFGIYTELFDGVEKVQIGTAFNKEDSRVRKIKINENLYITQLELTNYLRIISLTPLMDRVFIDTPNIRRKFKDRITWNFFSTHSKLMRLYDKVVRERNNLLKNNEADARWLENIEKQIVDFGINIIANRNKVLSLVNEKLRDKKNSGVVFPTAKVSLVGELEEIYMENTNINNSKEIYKEKLFNSRSLDSLRRTTSLGPHRTELIVEYEEKEIPAYLCSTGEQKGLLISIILAAVRASKDFHGKSPILLLDEVFAHLDDIQRDALSSEILDIETQAWMTSTEASHYMTFGRKSYIINLNNIDKSSYDLRHK